MKCCSRCKVDKALTEFFKTKRNKDGLQHACKSCMNDSYKASRGKNKDHYNKTQRIRRSNIVERVRKWKEEQGCSFCDECFGPCLELHHTDPSQKDLDPADASKISWQRFITEAEKCIVVCANCHRKIHHGLISVLTPR